MRGDEYVGAVEFRVFAGTTSLVKVLHHLATVLGLFGRLHREFSSHGPEALRLCRKFDERYPDARL